MSELQNRCINCDVRLSRTRCHVLSNMDENVRRIIESWTYFSDRNETDCICHACWELASFQVNANAPARQVGHRQICIACGRSILRSRSRHLLTQNLSVEQEMIATVISTWIQPRQLTSDDQACLPCWLRAQRASVSEQPLQSVEVRVSSDGENTVNEIVCINCSMPISSDTAHVISSINQNLLRIVNLWTYASNMQPTDYICNSCWEIAMYQLRNECIVCSISTMDTDSHLIEQASEEEIQLSDIINERIHPRQVTSSTPICASCWEQAQEELLRRQERQLRSQSITLPNLKRVSESVRYCLFRGCQNTERNHVPDNIRRRVLTNYNVFIPRESRICNYHLGRNHNTYEELYTADYILDYFNPAQIEDMIFILTEDNNFQFDNIQELPDHWVHYWIGISKDEHGQILNECTRLQNMRRGSLALTALLCKLRTGDSNERLSTLFQVPRRTLETLMNVARELLEADYVPRHLGLVTYPGKKWQDETL